MTAVVDVAHSAGQKVKVIFENCYLTDAHKMRLCEICGQVGADWVKTSTGYGSGGATLEDLKLMRAHSPDHVQVKAAGPLAPVGSGHKVEYAAMPSTARIDERTIVAAFLAPIGSAAMERQRAEALSYTVVEPTSVVATHIAEVVKQHADEMLTREEVGNLVEDGGDFGVRHMCNSTTSLSCNR